MQKIEGGDAAISSKIRHRQLWVLKQEYRETIAAKAINVGLEHKAIIGNAVKEGCEIIGYIRKSPSNNNEKSSTRMRLLESMASKLKQTSFVSKVFASYSSCSNAKFKERDNTKQNAEIPGCCGDTNATTKQPVCNDLFTVIT
ncbi:hypothetical protein PS6_011591 [Mucor atramentarius]